MQLVHQPGWRGSAIRHQLSCCFFWGCGILHQSQEKGHSIDISSPCYCAPSLRAKMGSPVLAIQAVWEIWEADCNDAQGIPALAVVISRNFLPCREWPEVLTTDSAILYSYFNFCWVSRSVFGWCSDTLTLWLLSSQCPKCVWLHTPPC